MEQFGSIAKNCFSLIILLLSFKSMAFQPGERIKATDLNNYYNELNSMFTTIDADVNLFINQIHLSKKKIKNIYSFSETKNSSTTNIELFKENLPEGSYLCQLSTDDSQFNSLMLSFYIGIVSDPLATVNYPISPSAVNLQGKTFNLTHQSSVDSNFTILFNTNHTFTNVLFNLKCRKMI